jgi:hypothetical protein
MLANTWNSIFGALYSAGALLIIVFYFYPKFFESTNPTNKYGPLYMSIIIYAAIWFIVLILYYFYDGKSNAEIKGLWKLKPTYSKESEKYDLKSQMMVPATGLVELLSEKEATKYLTETFTFSFFVSVDHSSIEGIQGESLKNNYKPYQLIVSVPGVYDIYIDPFHEMLSIEFHSYKTSNYTVNLPTLKSSKWHQILISIEGRTADIYQNGMLLKSVGLKNVIATRPGKPKVNMNPEIYATVAFIQSWPMRLKESEIVTNYRWNTDAQGVPPLPSPIANIALAIPGLSIPVLSLTGLNFCVGSFCTDTISSETDALTYVNYEYA